MTIDEGMATREGTNPTPTEPVFPPFPPVAGEVPAGRGTTGPTGPAPAPASKRSPAPGAMPEGDTAVTRLMCSTVHLNANYADKVSGTLLDPLFVSMAPNWGVDLVALGAHTTLSRNRRIKRDGNLAVLLVSSAVLMFLLAVTVPYGGLSLIQATVMIGVVLVGTWLIAFLIVFNHYDLVRMSALEVMKPDLPARETAPALSEATEARLTAAATANVVVFGEYNPFVSFGTTLDSWSIVVDLEPASSRQDSAEGLAVEFRKAAEVGSFTSLDVHRHLIQAMAEKADDLYTGSICFANGATATAVPGLIPRPPTVSDWPAQHLPQQVLDDMVTKPAENQRAYVIYSRTVWRGEIVLTGLVRAERKGSRLLIEGRTHVLLPLKGMFRETKYVAEYSSRVFWQVARPAFRHTGWLLMGSVRRRSTRRRAIWGYVRMMRNLCKVLNRGVPRNYGAKISVREDASSPADLKYYGTVDEVMQYKMLTRQVLDVLADFLTAQGADLTQFDQQRTIILHRRDFSFNDTGQASSAFGPKSTSTSVSAGAVVTAPGMPSGD